MTDVTATTGPTASPGRGDAALGPWPQPMHNPVRNYGWGSRSALAALQGRAPSGEPEAELWMGAHPSAPSRLGADDAPGLDELIADRPDAMLGTDVHDRFGARLPFMLKLLAIAGPLSLQVHPTADRARAAYLGEIDVPGEHRYVDPYAKPEMLYALEPVDAMCGFRSVTRSRRLLELVGGGRLASVGEPLYGRHGEADVPDDEVEECARIEAAFARLVHWPEDDRADLVAEVAAGTRRLLAEPGTLTGEQDLDPDDRRAISWAARLTRQFPKDPLVAAPFLLDLVQLQPGESMFVPAGAPHAYLHGLGLEIMSNSDNVLRAGLTHKPIAVEELLQIVHGGSRPEREVPQEWVSPYEVIWTPGAAEFRLSRLWLLDSSPVEAYPQLDGPQIVLCTAGTVRVGCGRHEVQLSPGNSAFVGAGGAPLTVSGPGEVFRAFAGHGRP